MITDQVLDLAVEKGLILRGQAAALRSLARQEDAVRWPEPADEETLRLVSGFADIFVTLGIVLFLGSATYLLGDRLPGAGATAVVAALAWGLAEFFTRRRRMALPSIVLLLAFTCAVFATLSHLLGSDPGGSAPAPSFGWLAIALSSRLDPLVTSEAALGTAAGAALHYWRFRVPVTIAAGAAALATAALMLLTLAAPDATVRLIDPILFGFGLAVFGLAMRFDLADPARQTRRTDIAFWLHLLASPLIVHSTFDGIIDGRGQIDTASAALVLLVFLALGSVAVLVDRRALLVSGLVYAGLAFGSLIRQAGLADASLPYTLLALGAFVLLLSAGWTPLRRAFLATLPREIAGRLPAPLPT